MSSPHFCIFTVAKNRLVCTICGNPPASKEAHR